MENKVYSFAGRSVGGKVGHMTDPVIGESVQSTLACTLGVICIHEASHISKFKCSE